MLSNARQRSRRDGVTCSIKVDDIVVPSHCPVIGHCLRSYQGLGKGPRNDSPTLDKIVPALGYVPGNILVVSHKANRIKNQLSTEQLAMFARAFADAERRMKETQNG